MKIELDRTYLHIHLIAQAIESEAKIETQLGLLALANAFHNRFSIKEQNKNLKFQGDIILSAIDGVDLSTAPGSSHLEILALVAEVFAGDQSDPTLGATCFHLHDQVPAWSKQRRCVALIGRRFYYR